MQPFTYEPLPKGHIRLLTLLPRTPGSVGKDSPLRGRISHIPLLAPTLVSVKTKSVDGDAGDDGETRDYRKLPQSVATLHHETPFEALSYNWGSDTKIPYTLLLTNNVDDASTSEEQQQWTTFPIRTSLYHALCQFAPDAGSTTEGSGEKGRLGRNLWVDAICINQSPTDPVALTEHAKQLWLMPEIYRIATRVLVYLGPEAEDSSLAIDFVGHVAEYSEYLDSSLCLPDKIDAGFALAVKRGFRLPDPVKDVRTWKAWRAFWRRAWFRRIWIVQEFVYSTSISMWCGAREIDWLTLRLAAAAYTDCKPLIYTGFNPDLGPGPHMDEFREAHEGAAAFLACVGMRMEAWGGRGAAFHVLSWTSGRSKAGEDLVREGIWADDKSERGKVDMARRRDREFWSEYEGFTRATVLQARTEGNAFPFERWDLLELFQRTRNFYATNPADRLYALLNLVDDVDKDKLEKSEFEPVYGPDQTADVVCTRFAAALIKRGRLQEVISMAGMTVADQVAPDLDEQTRARFPTWVPDWVSVRFAQEIKLRFCYQMATEERLDQTRKKDGLESKQNTPRLYNAAMDSVPQFRLDAQQPGTLKLTGRPFDTIRFVVPSRLLLSPLWYEAVLAPFLTPYSTGEPLEEVIWRTLIANNSTESLERPTTSEFGAQYAYLKASEPGNIVLKGILLFIANIHQRVSAGRATSVTGGWHDVFIFLVWLLRDPGGVLDFAGRSSVGVSPTIWRHLGGTEQSSAGHRPSPDGCAGYVKSLGMTVTKFNLGVTVGGKLGLVPLSAQAGDRVVVFHGCAAPFVIRGQRLQGGSSFHQLVGEAYVHGVMDGEIMTSGEFKEEEIELR